PADACYRFGLKCCGFPLAAVNRRSVEAHITRARLGMIAVGATHTLTTRGTSILHLIRSFAEQWSSETVSRPGGNIMKRTFACLLALLAVLVLFSPSLAPSLAATGRVHVRFEVSAPHAAPFPSDRFTVPDSSNNTGLRVALPKPDCLARPSDCADLDVI